MAEVENPVCPKGHRSTEADYCSECGAKIGGASAVDASGAAGFAGQLCPDCGTVREQPEIGFCEVCGYNFRTGAHGEIGILPEAPSPELVVALEPPTTTEQPQRWLVRVESGAPSHETDPSGPLPMEPPFTVELKQDICLVGRPDETRGIAPEIAIRFDEAVSRRHALLQREPGGQGWLLRDIGAANGTRLNGVELEPMRDYPVTAGDEVTLGHRTRLRLDLLDPTA